MSEQFLSWLLSLVHTCDISISKNISISIRMCSVNRCDISMSLSIRKRKLFLFLMRMLMLMLMSRYHKCELVRHKHEHKHNEAAVFDISGNIIENSAKSLPADLQFQDGVFYRFFGKISRSCSHLSLFIRQGIT